MKCIRGGIKGANKKRRRKAALSFAPSCTTTGSTIKVFAENGKLFRGEYRISLIS
jgi:hypothetical protein